MTALTRDRTPKRIAAATAALVLVLGMLGVTLARAQSPGQTYTGCLKLGLVFNVKIGTSPYLPCPPGSVQISWNQTGPPGANGTNGMNGTNGADGRSAYEIWLDLGNSGTEQQFIDSLKGSPGQDGTLALAGQTCPGGEFVTGFDQSGDIVCGDGSPPPPPPPPIGVDCEPLNAVPGADLRNCDLSGVDLNGADLHNALLGGADLTGANLSGANLSGASLGFANLSGADLSNAVLVGAAMSPTDLVGTDLSGADLSDAYLVGDNLTGANLSGATLTDASLGGATLSDANLAGANLFGADLSGVFWANTTCPDGTNSNSNGFTCVGHLF
jgi:hypothetical protein